jgi:hypothetical protein
LLQQNTPPSRSTLVDGSMMGLWQCAHVPMAAWLVCPLIEDAQLLQQNALPSRSTIVE